MAWKKKRRRRGIPKGDKDSRQTEGEREGTSFEGVFLEEDVNLKRRRRGLLESLKKKSILLKWRGNFPSLAFPSPPLDLLFSLFLLIFSSGDSGSRESLRSSLFSRSIGNISLGENEGVEDRVLQLRTGLD